MAGAELFTVLAVLEARDRLSEKMEKAEAIVNRFSGSLQRMGTVAEESGARTDQALLQTASGANALDLAAARVDAAQAKLAAATRDQAAAEQELLDVQRRLAAGQMDAAEAADKQSAAYARLQKAERDTAAASKDLSTAQKVQADTNAAAAAKNDAAAASQGRFSGAMAAGSSLMAKATKAAMFTGAAVGAVGYESVKAASQFQTLTTQLVTTAGEAPARLKQVQDGILGISTQTATSADELAKSMYIVEASGYDAAHGGLDVLKAATEGARLENSDFATVANGVTDILKDYHLGAGDAANVTSQLVAAVGHGKANFQQFSAALSNILPLGASVGLKFNDLAGVLAEMTSHGVTAQRASQNMANALRSLEAPTGTMVKEFDAVGITAKDVQKHLADQGLGGTLQWLAGIAKDSAPKLGQTYPGALRALMGTAAGLNVALMSTGENAEDVNKAVKDIGEASADAQGNVSQFSTVQQTFAFKMDQAKQAIHNTGIAIGQVLLPMVSKIADRVNKFLGPLAGWVEKHEKLVGSILTVAGALSGLVLAIAGVAKVIGLLKGAFALLEANPVVAAITLIVAGLIYAYTHFKAFRQVVDEIGTFLKGVFVEAWHAAGRVIDWFSKNVMPEVKRVIKDVIDWFKAHKQQFSDAWNEVVKEVQHLVKWFDDNVLKWVRQRIAEFIDWWRQHSQEIHQAWSKVWKIVVDNLKWTWSVIKDVLKVISDFWSLFWGLIKDDAKLVWDVIKNVVSAAMHSIENVIAIVLDIITGRWGKLGNDLLKLLKDAFNDITRFLSDLGNDFGRLLWDAGRNLIKGLINGIKDMGGTLYDTVAGVAKQVRDFWPFSPAKTGPLSGSGSMDIAGRNLGKMLAGGIRDSTGLVTNATAAMARAARPSLGFDGMSAGGGLGPMAAGLGGGGGTVIFDLRGAQVLGDHDMDKFVTKLGQQVATRLLPAGGVRVRM